MSRRSVSNPCRPLRLSVVSISIAGLIFQLSYLRLPSTSLAAASQPSASSHQFGARTRASVDDPPSSRSFAMTPKGEEQGYGRTVRPEVSSGPSSARPPELASKQAALLDRAAAAAALVVPVKADGEGQLISTPTEPETIPVAATVALSSSPTQNALASPSAFKYLTVSDLSTSAAPTRSIRPSPSVAAAYGTVFMTGNWFAARSTDFGRTWQYTSPFTTFASVNGGFCCQQDTIYDSSSKSFIWSLLYSRDSTSNSVRIARASLSDVAANNWTSYRFSPETFGYGAGYFFDDPKISKSEGYLPSGSSTYQVDLVVAANVFKISDQSFVGAIIWRIPTTQMAVGASVSPRYYKTGVGGLRCTTGNAASGELTCVGFSTQTKLKVFVWSGTTINSTDVTAPAFSWLNGDGAANTPDGKNWAGGETSDVQAVWTEPPPSLEGGPQTLIVAWAAKQDASHPYPYVMFAAINPSGSSWVLGNKYALWSSKNAWLYPAAADDGFSVAGSVAYGGGEFYPGTNVWTVSTGSPITSAIELQGAAASNAGPADNRWGGSFTVREVYGGFVAATYYLKDGGGSSNVVPRFLWFGKEGSMTPAVGAVNAASFRPAIARDSIVALFGDKLATRTSVATGTVASTLADRSVLVGYDDLWVSTSILRRQTTSLFFVSPGQINLLVQDLTPTGASVIQVTDRNASTYGFGTVEISNVAPGLFSANADGQGVPSAVALRVKSNGAQSYEPVSRWDGAKFVSTPIDLGPASDQVFLILYGTGLRYRSSLAAVSARLGGLSSEVLYAGAQGSFAGLDQINVRIPRGLIGRGEVDVNLTADGQTANTVRVNIR